MVGSFPPPLWARRLSQPIRYLILAVTIIALVAGGRLLFQSPDGLPQPGSDDYRDTVRAFYRGVAAVEVGLLGDARIQFEEAARLSPAEPAIAANLAVAHVGFGDDEAAVAQLEVAHALAPDSTEIVFLQGQLAGFRGQFDDAVAYYRRAVELGVDNVKARFALAQELAQSEDDASLLEAQQLFEQILDRHPENLAVLVVHARLASTRGDSAAAMDTVDRLRGLSGGWPSIAQDQFNALSTAVSTGELDRARTLATLLRNVLVRVTAFLESQAVVSVSAELVVEPLRMFLRLPSPSPTAAPLDDTLVYNTVEPAGETGSAVLTTTSILLSNDAASPVVMTADERGITRVDTSESVLFPWGAVAANDAIALRAFDWNSDFRTDLAVTGGGEVGLFEQTEAGTFNAVPIVSENGNSLVLAEARSLWVADFEMDGDLDVLLGTVGSSAELLQNNADGTWEVLNLFPDVDQVVGFVWGDLDRDGDPDAALLDAAGQVSFFANRQAGQFTRRMSLEMPDAVAGMAIGDLDADGRLDLVTLDASGSIASSVWEEQGWQTTVVTTWDALSADGRPGSSRLFLADLDNNGALDVVASGLARGQVWLSDERSRLQPLAEELQADIFDVVDLNGDGWLDFVGVVDEVPVQVLGQGSAGYQWQEIRPRAQLAAGDQRINSFGVGGEIQVRSGLLVQRQVLTGAPLHFGLGTYPSVDVTRIVWPNGVMQADFDFAAGQVVVAEQRLKGSCPWLFSYDGTQMRFVTDFLWRSPLGLRINAQDTAGISQTEDRVLVRGDQLVARDGEYDLRITAELWETHFFDSVSLMVVDHPIETEVYVDERFARDPVSLDAYVMGPSTPVAEAWDDRGMDVTNLVAERDGHYLASVERGRYQGVTQTHDVEFDLGASVTGHEAIYLLAHGWVYPTDSSINLAIGQGNHPAPMGIMLEAKDQSGTWQLVHPDLGFPAGKNKTIVVEVTRLPDGSLPRHFRFRTNLEVYWDWIGYGPQLEENESESIRLEPVLATLRYRGFSETDFHGSRKLEIPRYEIANTRARWRDLVGFHTRFGDVGELLADVDDRYVIMNAGDELRLRFAAPEPPAEGWTRDYIFVGDGWIKDGDYNTTHSKTVGPLPSHSDTDYPSEASAELETDPVYLRHSEDWTTYHTRYVSPSQFVKGLVID